MAAADWLNVLRIIFHVMTFSRLCFIREQFPTHQKVHFVRLNIFLKEKKKDLLILIPPFLNANLLYVRLDKDNVSLSNPAERGEVLGGKSPSSLNLV